ncbi:hypothetical protein LINPERPRIM_LOCUS40498 [Linum perenne]
MAPTESASDIPPPTAQSSSSVIDSSSPFFIHPSENWGQCLVSSILTETNYTSWERSMMLVLAGKNKLGFVDGSIPAPQPIDSLFPLWTRNNQLLLSWIQRSVSPSIAQSILWITSARDAWCELKERFSQGDAFRIADLQERIFAFRQLNLSISEYFTQLKSLWDELVNFRSIPVCVMLMEPLPSVNRAFSIMIQQERHISSMNLPPVPHTENMAFLASSGSNLSPRPTSFKPKGKRPVCSYCGFVGHTVDVCYKKHDFPPGYKPRPRQSQQTHQFHNSQAHQPNHQSQAHCVASYDA